MKKMDHAYDFTAELWNGGTVTLSELEGRKVWLAFFRYASCPLCNLRVRDIINAYPRLQEANVEVLAVFQSPKENIAQYVGRQEPPFSLIADPAEKLYKLYGLTTGIGALLHPRNLPLALKAFASGFLPGTTIDGPISRIPADFLINEDGVVEDIYRGTAIGEHIPFERVWEFANMRTGAAKV